MVKIYSVLVAAMLCGCGYGADCTILCSIDTGVPDGLACGAEGLCHSVASADTCVLPSNGTGGTITHAGGRTIHTFTVGQFGATFVPPADVPAVEVLIVAGGGGGGTQRGGGGGGAGGLVHMAAYAVARPSYVVVVSSGGAPSASGGNSMLGMITALGGGGGAHRSCGGWRQWRRRKPQ